MRLIISIAIAIFWLFSAAAQAQEVVGQIESPSSDSASAWNDRFIAIALFEQISTDVEINVIDRNSGATSRIVLPRSYIVYSMFFDKDEPTVLWATTSQRAALFRINVADGSFREIATFGDQRYIFAGAQHPSGDIYLGTYPDAKVYSVSNGKTSEITEAAALVGQRTNVKDVFIPSTGFVFFHIGSPGTLIGFDPQTRKVATILDTPDPFLFPARDSISPIDNISSVADFGKRPLGTQAPASVPAWARKLFAREVFQLKPDGFRMIVVHDGMETSLSTRPRNGGMPITAFKQVTDRLAVGSTYWNRWFFKFDLSTNTPTPLGPIGRTGEFFTACSFNGVVAIPHYLGLLLEWHPDAPLQAPAQVPLSAPPETIATAPGDNPRELLMRPDGHLGLDCLDGGGGELIYSTLPNYNQPTGQLWRVAVTGTGASVIAHRNPPQTVQKLALVGGRLYGGTSEFRGLGLQRLEQPPRPRVVELDPRSLEEIRSVEIPLDRYRNTTGLIALSDKRLLLGTEGGGLYLIDIGAPDLTAQRIGPRCLGVSSLVLIAANTAAALCGGQLFVIDGGSGGISDAASLPADASYMAVAADGGVVATSKSSLIKVPAAVVAEAARRARTTVSTTNLIADGEFDVYKLPGVLAKDATAWISPRPAADAIGKSFVGMDLGDQPEEIVGANVIWVLPPNTPAMARFEYSDDGVTWFEAASRKTVAAPSTALYWLDRFSWPPVGRHRYWRVTPAEGLKDQFAVEFLEFQRQSQ